MSPKNTSSNSSLSGRAIFFMCLLTIQFGIQPMLTRKFTPSTACKTSVIIVQESLKFVFAMSMLLISGGFKSAIVGWTIMSWLKVAALPAFLYSIQNICALLAYQNLDGVTFNVLNQTKTLSAALCCYLLMGKQQTRIQILALFLLLGSALIIEQIISIDFILDQIMEDTTTATTTTADTTDLLSSDSNRRFTHGVIPVLIASFLSGLAGAISQKNLQTNTNTNNTKPSSTGRNPYLFSAELCVASTLLLTTSLLFVQDGTTIAELGFFHGWTIPTLIPITTNAIGGIIVGLVTKYAGSVRKGFALIFGMLFTGMVQSG
eukprot:CAMPEP_0198251446 /NCGR_PEP_ID=MMETSP1447-20131203/2278_1 /TAXON_ID=420782 /ORGANISM="Chaetoceros dichaeta, Strain CCMP1751" /LENGTH=318 /DNA_ID=CAMNT_0043936467 /DNA_START=153 /DNA_END=1105 /DNA_ORIENTATION=+